MTCLRATEVCRQEHGSQTHPTFPAVTSTTREQEQVSRLKLANQRAAAAITALLSGVASLGCALRRTLSQDIPLPIRAAMTETSSPARLRDLTAQIVAAHISHNPVTPEVLLGLISIVHEALAGTGRTVVAAAKPQPAVPLKRSVFPDHIVCLEDGKKLKMLKRHLMTTYHLTPDQYRQKWGLPASYPMVAPDYAVRRSALAKSIGLGRKPAAPPTPVVAPAPAKGRGRPPRKAAA